MCMTISANENGTWKGTLMAFTPCTCKLPATIIPAICCQYKLLHILISCLNSANHALPGSADALRRRQRQRKPPQPLRPRPRRRRRGTILRPFRSTARRIWPRGGSAIHRKVHSLATEHAVYILNTRPARDDFLAAVWHILGRMSGSSLSQPNQVPDVMLLSVCS